LYYLYSLLLLLKLFNKAFLLRFWVVEICSEFCCDQFGDTLLHHLVNDNSYTLDDKISLNVLHLIQKGIPINHKNSAQKTVLDITSRLHFALIYQVLVSSGAKLGKQCDEISDF
jgi:hypothetical protein